MYRIPHCSTSVGDILVELFTFPYSALIGNSFLSIEHNVWRIWWTLLDVWLVSSGYTGKQPLLGTGPWETDRSWMQPHCHSTRAVKLKLMFAVVMVLASEVVSLYLKRTASLPVKKFTTKGSSVYAIVVIVLIQSTDVPVVVLLCVRISSTIITDVKSDVE